MSYFIALMCLIIATISGTTGGAIILMEKSDMDDNVSERFYKLYEPVEGILFRVVLKVVKNTDAARDVLQNVAAIGIYKFEQLRKKENFNAWISSIATFEAYSYCKKKNIRNTFENTIDPKDFVWLPRAAYQNNVERNLERSAAIAIQQLELIDQQIIYMHFHLDMNFSEIAELTKLTPAAVKMRLKRAFNRLRKLLEEVL